jgi:hypothetical protein
MIQYVAQYAKFFCEYFSSFKIGTDGGLPIFLRLFQPNNIKDIRVPALLNNAVCRFWGIKRPAFLKQPKFINNYWGLILGQGNKNPLLFGFLILYIKNLFVLKGMS